MRFALLIVAMLLLGPNMAYAEPDYEALANAIKRVEGVPYYGIKSVKWDSYAEARRICINTCRNQWKRHQAHKCGKDYLDCLADRYCPKEDDPRGNKDWKVNIKAIYGK